MTPTELRETFIDRPEFLLALMFSTPDVPADEILSSITVDFTEAEVVARVRRQPTIRSAPRLLATKQDDFRSYSSLSSDLRTRS